MVQGSHIVVRRLYDHDRCYIFQNADNRIIFAIPYERDFTLIGTTDRDFAGDPAAVASLAGGDRISLSGGERIFRFSRDAGRRGLVLFRRAPALRRRRERGAGRHPGLCAGARFRGRRAAAVDLRRQDHDLSPSRPARARQARRLSPGRGEGQARLDRRRAAARRRIFRRRASRRCSPISSEPIPGSGPSRREGSRAPMASTRARCSAMRRSPPTSVASSAPGSPRPRRSI